jgi:pimeloyl-ACP methyl ester carboxylesterase
MGGDASKPPLLLIHGFGASVYHWRYNIPALSEKYHVYALDLLGFGLSDKPVQDYPAEVWKDQVL